VSRSFGDVQFKGAGSSASPDVTAFSVTARERFLLCACDGFWSVVDPQDAVDIAAEQLRTGKDAKGVCNRLLNEAVTVRRCKDNCSVLLVVLHAQDAV
jgi:serine/threonine protein phosphatase PrpC